MQGYQFYIAQGPEDCVTSWLKERIAAIRVCLDSSLREPALTLIYAGIDTLGLLDAPANQIDASRSSFVQWSENYILPSLSPIAGSPVAGLDLYAARCGILHASSPISQLARAGTAREIWYQFKSDFGVNLRSKASGMPLLVDIEDLSNAFEHGSNQFLAAIKADKTRFDRAVERANQFFAWGIGSVQP